VKAYNIRGEEINSFNGIELNIRSNRQNVVKLNYYKFNSILSFETLSSGYSQIEITSPFLKNSYDFKVNKN
jgi:hypothetical protein